MNGSYNIPASFIQSDIFNRCLFYTTLAVVFIFSVMPRAYGLPEVFSASDVLNHFAAFFVLSYLFNRAYPGMDPKARAVLLAASGALIEVVQAFVPYRTCSAADLAVDCLAIAAYLWVKR